MSEPRPPLPADVIAKLERYSQLYGKSWAEVVDALAASQASPVPRTTAAVVWLVRHSKLRQFPMAWLAGPQVNLSLFLDAAADEGIVDDEVLVDVPLCLPAAVHARAVLLAQHWDVSLDDAVTALIEQASRALPVQSWADTAEAEWGLAGEGQP